MRRKSIFVGVCITLLALALTGCPERIRIGDIQHDPGRYYDKEVTVAGRVVRSYGALGQGVYEIDDGTGTMWVIAQGNPPNKGAELAVTGTFGNVASWGGRNYGTGISEDKRHYRRR